MRILYLCKRRYTGKDLLADRYGRLFEIPAGLAAAGHDVHGIALNYSLRPGAGYPVRESDQVAWSSIDMPYGAIAYAAELKRVGRSLKPHIVVASSDALHAVVGARVAARLEVPFVVDMYDNYESFSLTRLPFLRGAFRRACRRADGITVVSGSLKDLVRETYGSRVAVEVIGNGVRTDLFRPAQKAAARRKFGLPQDLRLVGTAGALVKGRGVSDLVQAFEILSTRRSDVRLVVAGPRDRHWHPPAEGVIDLGVLPHEAVGELVGALDVAVVCNRDSAFGRYCYPLKLNEALACGVPVVAAAVGDVAWTLAESPASLYAPGDASELAERIGRLLDHPSLSATATPSDWLDVSRRYGSFLESVLEREAAGRGPASSISRR